MGEFASYDGTRVKIGTCEDMYYLRADQRDLVRPVSGSVRPASVEDQKTIRFRFPWPDEDDVKPGEFDHHSRGFPLHVPVPEEVNHGSVQFSAPAGYLVSMECPESGQGSDRDDGLKIGRNGFSGNLKIVQQAYRNGNLALVCACAGCGTKFNLPTIEDAQPVIDALLEKAKNRRRDYERNDTLDETIANRIREGYSQ